MARPVVFWFRRDLRLQSNRALAEASSAGPIVPVFVLDSHLLGPAGPNRRWFLNRSLEDLNDQTGGRLIVRSGDPSEVLGQLAGEVGAEHVFATDDFGPYGRRRDTAVGEHLAGRGISTHYRGSNYAVAPGTLRTKTGGSYQVFTPYFRSWRQHLDAAAEDHIDLTWGPTVGSEVLPDRPEPTAPDLPTAGHDAAWRRFEQFRAVIADYPEARDRPSLDGTSRLSPYLKWGTLHPLQLVEHLGHSPGEDEFVRQLCWRDFYADVLFHRPDSARRPYAAHNAVRSDTDAPARRRFHLWRDGHTGYPIVDAGMRQLLAEGWMHNRVRMITASFLVKDLHVPWQWGARHFLHHLVDGDLASNNHGWQWVAGTGTDASPYYRVFNPTTQSQKFDPDGDYIRRWVPELARVPARFIHDPTHDPRGAPAPYPPPIVDHAVARAEALARYEQRRRHR